MTQEDKKLLKRDLCARLPYDVRIWHSGFLDPIGMYPNEVLNAQELEYMLANYEVKPYLRKMSSMTELELNRCDWYEDKRKECPYPKDAPFEERLDWFIKSIKNDMRCIDWLNTYHFDYRGLIELGLAIEAPELMYGYYK